MTHKYLSVEGMASTRNSFHRICQRLWISKYAKIQAHRKVSF